MTRTANTTWRFLMMAALLATLTPVYADLDRAKEDAIFEKLKQISPPSEAEVAEAPKATPTETPTPTPSSAASDNKPPVTETGEYAKIANVISFTQGIDPRLATELIKLASKRNAEAAEKEEQRDEKVTAPPGRSRPSLGGNSGGSSAGSGSPAVASTGSSSTPKTVSAPPPAPPEAQPKEAKSSTSFTFNPGADVAQALGRRRPSAKADDEQSAIVSSIASYVMGSGTSGSPTADAKTTGPVVGAATKKDSSASDELLSETQSRLLENVRLQKPRFSAPQPGALDINSVAAGRFPEPLYGAQAKVSALPPPVFIDTSPTGTAAAEEEPLAPAYPTHQRK